jgi:hypothetical protein
MKRRRLLSRTADDDEAFALCLLQKRHDENGNRIEGHTFEQVQAMTPGERQVLKARCSWPITEQMRRMLGLPKGIQVTGR